jgi:hypothetical protein
LPNYASKYKNMKRYIYTIIVNQLKNDVAKFYNNDNISTLAKWLPRSDHNFTKKIKGFLKTFTSMYYNININNVSHQSKILYYKKYDNLIKKLSEYLDVTEIHIANNELEKINFDNISFNCLIRNKKIFAKNKISEQNYIKCMYNKLINKSLSYLINIIIKYDIITAEKELLNKIFCENIKKYQNELINNIDIDFSKYDMLADLSKTIYDNNNINNMLAIILVLQTFGTKIILNGKKCKFIDTSNVFCDNVNMLSFLMADCSMLNIYEAKKLTNKKIIVLSEINKINDVYDDNNFQDDIVYVSLNNYHILKKIYNNYYIGSVFHTQKIYHNFNVLKEILYNSEELQYKINVWHLIIYVIIYIIFINCILFWFNFII